MENDQNKEKEIKSLIDPIKEQGLDDIEDIFDHESEEDWWYDDDEYDDDDPSGIVINEDEYNDERVMILEIENKSLKEQVAKLTQQIKELEGILS